VIKIGTNAEYPPFEYVDENGVITGFDPELVAMLAARAGFEYELVNTRWDGIFVALASGEFDMVASAATITPEREEIVDFTNPYFYASQRIAVRQADAATITGPEDLAGLRVGVQAGTTGDIYASDNIPGAEVVRYDEITLAFQALQSGDVDAVLNDGPTSADIIAKNPDMGAVLVGDPLSEEYYGIAVQPDEPELLDALNTALAAIIADGSYRDLYFKWFAVEPPELFAPPK
jgi:ABC-type amino acid transport substrate-binding protein